MLLSGYIIGQRRRVVFDMKKRGMYLKHCEDSMRAHIASQFSNELMLVIHCSQDLNREDNETIIHNLLAKGVDWKYFLYLTDRHRVCPLVYRTLKNLGNLNLPNWVLEDLRSKARQVVFENMLMASEIISITHEMKQANIQPIILKGVPMGAQLYGDFTIRPSKDIDIFVRPEDIEIAKSIIEKRGFHFLKPEFELTPARLVNWLHARHHFDYWHKENRINVELHWRMGHPGMEIPIDIISENLSKVTLSGHVISALRDEVQLIYLVMHGASHKWVQLRWIQDIVLILERRNISWPTVVELAERLGVSSLICQAILLAYWIFGVKVDADIQKWCNEDKRGQKLAQMALKFLITGHNPARDTVWSSSYHRGWQYQFALQFGWKRKVQLLFNCARPVDEDIKMISLPDRIYSLYYMIRPLSWVKRRLGKMLKS